MIVTEPQTSRVQTPTRHYLMTNGAPIDVSVRTWTSLVGVKFKPTARDSNVRVSLGILLEVCERASRRRSLLLEVRGVCSGNYGRPVSNRLRITERRQECPEPLGPATNRFHHRRSYCHGRTSNHCNRRDDSFHYRFELPIDESRGISSVVECVVGPIVWRIDTSSRLPLLLPR